MNSPNAWRILLRRYSPGAWNNMDGLAAIPGKTATMSKPYCKKLTENSDNKYVGSICRRKTYFATHKKILVSLVKIASIRIYFIISEGREMLLWKRFLSHMSVPGKVCSKNCTKQEKIHQCALRQAGKVKRE
ncbi:hypothetical protein [Citrobacter rodentium]|nr:hypothetical protein [Citrobacter rodentium]HAT8015162.1 hypothetical protein [Citrobacter rodentium NBRC 105723 = DSM 16636]HAT8017501.1 hypothetical protein [Citrobacter rodentium]HAT8029780.1 hypothetical protein [Citrobacter rodentium]HAT8032305.1 hypothetical protein [Citrobacter rodentium]HAT8036776.1 hypothetical protein [Citrobacter rodentium]